MDISYLYSKSSPVKELKLVKRRLSMAGISFVSILLAGTIGFWSLGDHHTFLDGFYMTAITITTIGFREIIPVEGLGRIFTIFIAFSGIGIFTYFLSNLVALFIEGDLRKGRKIKLMENQVAKKSGHYIVCGCGRVGANIAAELQKAGKDFVLADINDKVLSNLKDRFGKVPQLTGDCTDDDFLRKLGIETAAGAFATANGDNTNLVICISIKQLNKDIRTIALIKDVKNISKMKKAGADKVVSPNYIGGLRMASEMIRPDVTDLLDDMLRSDSLDLNIEEINVPDRYIGKSLGDIGLEDFVRTIVLVIREKGAWEYKPDQSHMFKKNSKLIVITTSGEFQQLKAKLA